MPFYSAVIFFEAVFVKTGFLFALIIDCGVLQSVSLEEAEHF